MTLEANTRFLSAFDGKIYDKGDKVVAENQSDADYLIQHKLCSEPKKKAETTTKTKK